MNMEANTMTRPKIGLALGSGVGRGWAHIGVLKGLSKAGIESDVIAGTSIGALVAGVHLAGHMDALEHWACSLNRMRIMRYLDLSMKSGGILGGKRLERLLTENLGDLSIEHLPKPFITVATELATGHEIWLRQGPLVDALRASYALPGIFPPVELEGRPLVDGALVNPVPVSVCRAMGARLVIAVNLNADMLGSERAQLAKIAEGQKDNGNSLPGGFPSVFPGAFGAGMLDSLFRRDGTPSMFNVMASALNILQDRLGRSRLAGDPPDVTIAPQVGHIGLLDFDCAEELIKLGEEAVERSLPVLEEALTVLQP
ncbi:MAG: lysophospholipase [Rhodospirillaceae bacterium]|nr:lysophospholipase [Rhodospirillaceae bacterium]MBT5081089.1 lysophospholipase [Rhodospirillaceae bacterium]MBT5524616.1 lysophospholipase [Rhodospirillaceae bacterium]MBT5879866.1 lysophospholipase [Rhodospirillaceae bacterium]MBT6587777.1 lysophospholipase [Rhodospirillaceae bacterium]